MLYPRVTKILQATRPKDELIRLSKRGEEYDKKHGIGAWDSYCKGRASEGTALHLAANQYLLGETPQVSEAVQPYWTQLQQVLNRIGGEPAGLEREIENHTLGYAGRYDLRLYFPQTKRYALLDIKSSGNGVWSDTWQFWRKAKKEETRPRREVDRDWSWLSYKPREAFVQLALYKLASDQMAEPVHEIWIVCVAQEKVQLIQLKPHWWQDCYSEGVRRVKQYYEMERNVQAKTT